MKIPKEILPTATFANGPGQGLHKVREMKLKETLFERRHRSPDIAQEGLYREATLNINKLLNVPEGYVTLFFHGGATPAMDAVAWCLTDDSISGISAGVFSKMWCDDIAGQLPDDVKKDFIELGYNEMGKADRLNINTSLVILLPNETASGAVLPNEFLENVWKNKGKDTLVAWDATSCAGGRLLPSDAYDVMIFATQKCFGGGAGTSVLILSPRAIERIQKILKKRKVVYSLNLLDAVEKAKLYQTFNTPSTINIFMANEGAKYMLERGGLSAMDKLCRAHAQTVLDYVKTSPYFKPMITDEKYRSYITLTLDVLDGLNEKDINKALKETGMYNLLDGVEKYGTSPGNFLRIACFPFVDPEGTFQYEQLCKTLDFICKNLKEEQSK